MSLGWNYRVVYHPPSMYNVGDKMFHRGEFLAIHECYYNDDDEVYMMTIDPIVIGDEGDLTLKSLRWILTDQLKSLDKPILEKEITNGIFKEMPKEKQNELSKSIENKEQISTKNSTDSE